MTLHEWNSLSVADQKHDIDFFAVYRLRRRQFLLKLSRILDIPDVVDNYEENCLTGGVSRVRLNIHIDFVDFPLPYPLTPDPL